MSNHYGISIDIGTSMITLHLLNLRNFEEKIILRIPNPQNLVGFDVVTRIKFAIERKENYEMLRTDLTKAIERLIQLALVTLKIPPEKLDQIVIVGNTVMRNFLFGLSVACLIKPPFTVENKDAVFTTTNKLGMDISSNIECYSPSIVESFVGSDALAVLLNVESENFKTPYVIMDIGTNTEISIVTDYEILIASAPSGPAFEGMSLECGMMMGPGAITKVKVESINRRPEVIVKDNVLARGICGSGAISAISSMLEVNLLNSEGSFDRSKSSFWYQTKGGVSHYILVPAIDSKTRKSIYISQVDIRMLQQSKAAIYSAIQILLYKAGISTKDIKALYLTGSFGYNLFLPDAYRIGLIPPFPKARLKQKEDAAANGADILLRGFQYRKMIEALSKSAEYIDLMDNPEFEAIYARSRLFP